MRTSTSVSPSSRLIAMIPDERIFSYSSIAVFFTRPRRVEKKTNLPAVSRGTGMNADNVSSLARLNRFAIERPHALEMLDEILFGGGRTNLAAAAALLRAVERERSALDVAAVGDGDELILFDDEILDRELALGFDDLSASRIGEFFFDFVELARDQFQQFLLVSENFLVARNQIDSFFVFVFDFLALERSKAAQREIEDRLRL